MKRPGTITRRARINPGSGFGPRSSRIARKARIKASNPKRRRKNFTRAYGSGERAEFVRALPCLVCGPLSFGASQNAHVKTGGTGRKADACFVVPLCAPHHRSLHSSGVASFEARYAVNLESAAAKVERRWQAHLNRTAA